MNAVKTRAFLKDLLFELAVRCGFTSPMSIGSSAPHWYFIAVEA